jgi:hypothetical protein
MASLIRSAKSGNEWTENELLAFNIVVVDKPVNEFFGLSEAEIAARPLPQMSNIMLTAQGTPRGPSATKQDKKFLAFMEDAQEREESFVDDFVVLLLTMMGYEDLDDESNEAIRTIHARTEMGFSMCGQDVSAKADVVVLHRVGARLEYTLLVQEDKVRLSSRLTRR